MRMAERVVLVGFGPVGARFVEELLPAVRAGLVHLTVVGAEAAPAYNRVLLAEYAVGETERESLEITDADEAREAGVRILTDTTVVEVRRSRRSVLLGTGEQLGYDRLVLATGARAQLPTLDGVTRRPTSLRPPGEAHALDRAETALPRASRCCATWTTPNGSATRCAPGCGSWCWAPGCSEWSSPSR